MQTILFPRRHVILPKASVVKGRGRPGMYSTLKVPEEMRQLTTVPNSRHSPRWEEKVLGGTLVVS